MLKKNLFYKIWNLVVDEKKYNSSRAALFDLLKK
jgi:hypothetical protein